MIEPEIEIEAETEKEITFHNHIEMRVQAQIFTGRKLISTCMADPGQTSSLPAMSVRYDIYLKSGATGRGIAHKLDSEAQTFTLSQQKGRYVIT